MGEELCLEAALVESQRLPAGRLARVRAALTLEVQNAVNERSYALFREEEPRGLRTIVRSNDGLGGTATPVGDHRSAAGLCFNRHDAEIFFAGEKQRSTPAQVITDHSVGLPAQKVD